MLPTNLLEKDDATTKAGANWVDGDRFFDRTVELELLAERVHDGIHTLLTAQRRMGKTSLVRELLRRQAEEGAFETIFVDLEDATDPSDAIAEIGVRSKVVQGVWHRVQAGFANVLRDVGDRVDTLSVSDLQVKLRAGIDAGNRWRKGDEVLAALAESDKPVVLAIDELPILVNRLIRGKSDHGTPEGAMAADEFLSWLRKNAQAHQGRIVLILLGSVGLEPILRRAGLSAQANNYSAFELKPWNEAVATACLSELANTYDLDLPADVRQAMCNRLRCLVPHHVQQFFGHLHEYLRRIHRREATLEDVERVYTEDMLSVRGQADLDHYESRLKMVLGTEEYRAALELLTQAAVDDGLLSDDIIRRYRAYRAASLRPEDDPVAVEDVLHLLEHDGYLERQGDGYRFVSGLLEDWWHARHGRFFIPIAQRGV